MGQQQSTLKKSGYKIEKESESHAVVTKDGEKFFIRKIQVSELIGYEHDHSPVTLKSILDLNKSKIGVTQQYRGK